MPRPHTGGQDDADARGMRVFAILILALALVAVIATLIATSIFAR